MEEVSKFGDCSEISLQSQENNLIIIDIENIGGAPSTGFEIVFNRQPECLLVPVSAAIHDPASFLEHFQVGDALLVKSLATKRKISIAAAGISMNDVETIVGDVGGGIGKMVSKVN
ncbi:hypothetical protein [Paracoccus shandongensis]|uniref:hypothetical protein n=1 Tax=Paracoccus shandongensis TaxID=2816048 RepID=UPI001A8E3A1A|nr:hypothetical protein [Paracoccus shandongensis]